VAALTPIYMLMRPMEKLSLVKEDLWAFWGMFWMIVKSKEMEV
jgi:hypothetical protein